MGKLKRIGVLTVEALRKNQQIRTSGFNRSLHPPRDEREILFKTPRPKRRLHGNDAKSLPGLLQLSHIRILAASSPKADPAGSRWRSTPVPVILPAIDGAARTEPPSIFATYIEQRAKTVMRTTMGAVMLLIAVNGCGPPVYRIRTTVPWPDEWLVGPRRPDRIDLPLNLNTINWHKRTASRSVRARVNRIAASYPNALIMSREGFGDLRGKTGDRLNALSFVEVRVTGWPLPYSRESRRFNWNIEGVSLEQVLKQFSIGSPSW